MDEFDNDSAGTPLMAAALTGKAECAAPAAPRLLAYAVSLLLRTPPLLHVTIAHPTTLLHFFAEGSAVDSCVGLLLAAGAGLELAHPRVRRPPRPPARLLYLPAPAPADPTVPRVLKRTGECARGKKGPGCSAPGCSS